MQGCRFQPLLPFGVKRSLTLLYLLFSKFGNLLPSFPSLSQAPKWANIEPVKGGNKRGSLCLQNHEITRRVFRFLGDFEGF